MNKKIHQSISYLIKEIENDIILATTEKDYSRIKDEMKQKSSDVQKMTDEYVSKIDLITSTKQTEILKV